jgi:hypothetical protein
LRLVCWRQCFKTIQADDRFQPLLFAVFFSFVIQALANKMLQYLAAAAATSKINSCHICSVKASHNKLSGSEWDFMQRMIDENWDETNGCIEHGWWNGAYTAGDGEAQMSEFWNFGFAPEEEEEEKEEEEAEEDRI